MLPANHLPKSSDSILKWLLHEGKKIEQQSVGSFAEWKKIYDEACLPWPEKIDRAIVGGFLADRTAYAFASAFHSALHFLLPGIPEDKIAAFCITEKEGGHPKAIKTTLKSTIDPISNKTTWVINGQKQFVTCAGNADILFVAATAGTDSNGRNQLKLVQLEKAITGLTINVMDDLPFIPEISHGTMKLEDISVEESQILAGDAYSQYIKPFRMVEDVFVFTGLLGYLFRNASLYSWPRAIQENLLSLIFNSKSLVFSDLSAAETHIVFNGFQSLMDKVLVEIEPYWATASQDVIDHWERDKPLLKIAEKARVQRLKTAWANY